MAGSPTSETRCVNRLRKPAFQPGVTLRHNSSARRLFPVPACPVYDPPGEHGMRVQEPQQFRLLWYPTN